MTHLAERKTRLLVTTSEEVRERGKHRAVVLELKPGYLQVRLAGTRTWFPISYADVYQTAAKRAADRERAEKKTNRRATLLGRGGKR